MSVNSPNARREQETASIGPLNILRAQEDERAAIARDLHDEIGSIVGILQHRIDALEKSIGKESVDITEQLDVLRKEAGRVGERIRRIGHRLHPAILDDLGLRAALRDLAREFSINHCTSVKFVCPPVLPPLPSGVSGQLYRITQEALNNVAKHAGKACVSIRLTRLQLHLRLSIEDTGTGFDSAEITEGLGLVSIRERANMVNARLSIRSTQGKGVRILVDVPEWYWTSIKE